MKVLELSFLTIMDVDMWDVSTGGPVRKMETASGLSNRENLTQGFGAAVVGRTHRAKWGQ